MAFKLTLVKPAVRHVPVVLHFQWISTGALPVPLQNLRCTACCKPVGAGRVGAAWILDGTQERSVRLCEACSMIASTTVQPQRGGRMSQTLPLPEAPPERNAMPDGGDA